MQNIRVIEIVFLVLLTLLIILQLIDLTSNTYILAGNERIEDKCLRIISSPRELHFYENVEK